MSAVLPDVLVDGLRLVCCGTAASTVSAQVGAYYAGPGNAFWPTLYRVGLTPRLLAPVEFHLLPEWGIGLTDVIKGQSGVDRDLDMTGADAAGLRRKLARYRPRVLAFTSKTAAALFYGRRVGYGWQAEPVHDTRMFVLPSPSGAARRYWDVTWWQRLADAVRALGEENGT